MSMCARSEVRCGNKIHQFKIVSIDAKLTRWRAPVGDRVDGVPSASPVPQIEIHFQNTKKHRRRNETGPIYPIMTIVHTPQLQHKSSATTTTTITTRDQWATERECAPYLVDLARLPESQKDHLRATGFLQKVSSSSSSRSGKKKKNPTTTSAGDEMIMEEEEIEEDQEEETIGLLTNAHVTYLHGIWERPLRYNFVSLDASRPWMIYWCLHASDLLLNVENNIDDNGDDDGDDADGRLPVRPVTLDEAERAVVALRLCWSSQSGSGGVGGGFGGGVGQLPHAATTYAAVLALSILASNGCNSALQFLHDIRPDLHHWFHITLIKGTTGAVRMHEDGEIDVRASYCVVAVSKLLNLPIAAPSSLIDFCRRCQTWEGGFGGEPGNEAHGGYAFCALATLRLLLLEDNVPLTDVIDVENLRFWLVRRQLGYEGGFSGRTNKLVDGCYSFWQGGALALLDQPYDYGMLERYVLLCGQDVHGGLRDKPSKGRDFYHSCYCLSGLSIAVHQHHNNNSGDGNNNPPPDEHFGRDIRIGRTHPAFNIQTRHVEYIQAQFADQPIHAATTPTTTTTTASSV
jgi:protein farnesyltransferase subunit beta